MNNVVKQRIVGAIVLVALGVIFIPMFLTGEGDILKNMDSTMPAKPTYEIEAPKVQPLNAVPRSDKVPQVKTVPTPENSLSSVSAAPSATAMPAEPAAVSDSIENEGQPDSQSTDSPIAPLPGKPPKQSQATVEEEPETVKAEIDLSKRPETQVQPPDIKTSESVADSDGAESEGNKKAVPTVKSTADDVNKIQGKIESVQQAKATAAVPSTESSGSESSTDDSKSTESSRPDPIVNGYVVQLGSFSVEKNALSLRDKLRKAGHASFVEKFTRNSKTSYRVRVGPELTRELAEKLQAKLKVETKLNGFIVKYP